MSYRGNGRGCHGHGHRHQHQHGHAHRGSGSTTSSHQGHGMVTTIPIPIETAVIRGYGMMELHCMVVAQPARDSQWQWQWPFLVIVLLASLNHESDSDSGRNSGNGDEYSPMTQLGWFNKLMKDLDASITSLRGALDLFTQYWRGRRGSCLIC